jgi:nicotinamidase-related amidase
VTTLDTNRTALLVMDYQRALLAGYPNADALIDRTACVISQSRAAGIKIIYIRVAFALQEYAAIPAHNKAFAMMRPRSSARCRRRTGKTIGANRPLGRHRTRE